MQKKLSILFGLFVILFYPATLYAQIITTKNIHLTYSPNVFKYEYDSLGCMTISSDTIPIMYEDDLSSPALPLVKVSVLIGRNQEFDTLTYTMSKGDSLQDVYMANNPLSILTDVKDLGFFHRRTNFPLQKYPNENVKFLNTYYIEDYKILAFSICPYEYNTMSHKLTFIPEFNIDIQLRKELEPVASNDSIYMDESIMENIVLPVTNPEDMLTLYAQIPRYSYTRYNSNQYAYIIITNDSLASTFQPLAEWKTLKGVKTKVVTTTQIDDSINEEISPQLKIKKWLKANKSNTLKYVLLGGDDTIVPVQPCHEIVSANNGQHGIDTLETFDMPVDMFYSCHLGAFDWDANQNGLYGEIDDNVDFNENFAITRAPVRNKNEARIFVKKIISYESGCSTSQWNNNIMMCGNMISSMTETGISDAQSKSNHIYEEHIAPYWNGERTFFFDTGHNIENLDSSYSFSASHLQDQLMKGYNFIDVITHGDAFCWITRYGHYTNTMASSLVMPTPAIITTNACRTNMFDSQTYDPCMSEAFIRNPDCGVLAYIGSSREGLSSLNGSVSCNSSEWLNSLFYSYIMKHTYSSFGTAFKYAKANVSIGANSFLNARWITMATNAIGDPEMPVFTNTPNRFRMPSIDVAEGVMIIRNQDRARIAVISANDLGQSYYGVSSNVDSLICRNVPDTLFISLTKSNYIPLILYVVNGKTISIQNEILSGQQEIVADEIHIGKDIVPYKEEGPVVVSDGSTEIVSKHGVTIHNGFEVQQGAVFSIETRN